MEDADPLISAVMLVERYGMDAYSLAVSSMIAHQIAGDQAGERACLQILMAVQRLLEADPTAFTKAPPFTCTIFLSIMT